MLPTVSVITGGKVLVTGGFSDDSRTFSNSSVLFDPSSQIWSMTDRVTNYGRAGHTASVLRNRDVLVSDGYGQGLKYMGSVVLDSLSTKGLTKIDRLAKLGENRTEFAPRNG